MRSCRYLTIICLLLALALPATADFLDFSFLGNNKQIIELALEKAFIKLEQHYDLCDTLSNEHFGRNGLSYFNKIPFIAVSSERGLIVSDETFSPWAGDEDFLKYKGKYRPEVNKTSYSYLNCKEDSLNKDGMLFRVENLTQNICSGQDSVVKAEGLRIDSLGGSKKGWIIWLSADSDLTKVDSVKMSVIRRDLIIPESRSMPIEKPENEGTILGGIYVTPLCKEVGEIMFTLSGVLVLDKGKWKIDFPFVTSMETKEEKKLTPINELKREKDKREDKILKTLRKGNEKKRES